jgi:hypothetical protein
MKKARLAEVLEIEKSIITDNQDLAHLVLDSMEAIYRIKKEYNLHPSANFFL